MDNLPLENEKKIIKLEGELTLLHHKIDNIRDNHLHHIDLRINNIYKVLWFSLVNLVLTLIS
jgi:hypothetical protein